MPRRKTYKTPRGTKDILPEEQKYWQYIFSKIETLYKKCGYLKIETPIFEEDTLFTRSIGDETDIVKKEMYLFKDKGGHSLALRPEETAPVVRAYIEHGMWNLPQPVKVYYIGPFFRYDRPQAGRFRQFWQFGFEILGDSHPVIDGEAILLAWQSYQELGLSDLSLQINSVGCQKCRPQFKKILIDYYKKRKEDLCKDCKRRLSLNPLRLLDCKQKKCQRLARNAPQIIDNLCQKCHDHFTQVLEYLDEIDLPYNLNPHLVRGLDYYTKTVFEIWPSYAKATEAKPEQIGSQDSLGGGGRYDSLVSDLGGRATGAFGFSAGIERIILSLKGQKVTISEEKPISVFVVQLGEKAKKKSLLILQKLWQAGIGATCALSKSNIKSQLKQASRLKIPTVLILGQREIIDNTIIIRDMQEGMQEVVSQDRLIEELKKRI
jgi:histidyl-tRNA synthetase